MRHHVGGDEELPALAMRLVDADAQVVLEEVVVAHTQAVARHAGVHGIGAVGEGIAHIA